MPPRRRELPSRKEILHVTRRLAKERGEKLTIHDVRAELGIHSRPIDQMFGSWAALRRLVGLKCRRAPIEKVFTDNELISQYRRIAIEQGEPPTAAEYERLSGHKWKTLISRFGSREAVHRRARALEEYIQTFGTEQVTTGKARVPFDQQVLQRTWNHVRIGFALHASDIRDALEEQGVAVSEQLDEVDHSFPYDLLYVSLNDWPLCPVPVT